MFILNFAFKFIAFLSHYAEIKDSVQIATVTIRWQCWYQQWQKENLASTIHCQYYSVGSIALFKSSVRKEAKLTIEK